MNREFKFRPQDFAKTLKVVNEFLEKIKDLSNFKNRQIIEDKYRKTITKELNKIGLYDGNKSYEDNIKAFRAIAKFLSEMGEFGQTLLNQEIKRVAEPYEDINRNLGQFLQEFSQGQISKATKKLCSSLNNDKINPAVVIGNKQLLVRKNQLLLCRGMYSKEFKVNKYYSWDIVCEKAFGVDAPITKKDKTKLYHAQYGINKRLKAELQINEPLFHYSKEGQIARLY